MPRSMRTLRPFCESLGETYTEAELKEVVRVAHEALTQEQRKRMDPEMKRPHAVNRSVEFPTVD